MTSVTGIVSFFVADWLIDPRSNSVIRGKESIRIEPKAMQVLTLLASNAGQVVTREELEDVVWANMVVGPDALTNTIIKLRHALGDDARNARIIETIPKTGYRLIAPVREAEEGEIESPLERRLSAIPRRSPVAPSARIQNEKRRYLETVRTVPILRNHLLLLLRPERVYTWISFGCISTQSDVL